METVRDKMASRQHDLKLYLEYINPETKADVRPFFASQLPRVHCAHPLLSSFLNSGSDSTESSRQ